MLLDMMFCSHWLYISCFKSIHWRFISPFMSTVALAPFDLWPPPRTFFSAIFPLLLLFAISLLFAAEIVVR